MIVIDGRNIYGINRYQLKRKNGNNEERYLVKYKGIYKRGFKSSIDAYLFIKSVDEGNYTVVNEVPERKPQIDKRRDYSVREAAEKCVKTRGDALMLIDQAEEGFRVRMRSGDMPAAMADRLELCEKARADIERDMDRNKALKRLRLELTGH